jgi:hypothetical protein
MIVLLMLYMRLLCIKDANAHALARKAQHSLSKLHLTAQHSGK